MERKLHRNSLIALSILVSGIIVTAVAVAGSNASSSIGAPSVSDPRTNYANQLTQRPMVSSTSPEEVLKTILSRYGGSHIVAADLAQTPSVPSARKGTRLHFVLSVPANDQSVIRSEWEADLVQGAAADALELSGGQPVVGSAMDLKLPDGAVLSDMAGGMGDVVPGQIFQAPADDELIRNLTHQVHAAKLAPVSIEVLHADQPAPAVVAKTADSSAAAAAAATTVRALFGQNPPKYEGYYFEVRDKAGDPLFIQSASFRSGAGRLWISPRVAAVTSLQHG